MRLQASLCFLLATTVWHAFPVHSPVRCVEVQGTQLYCELTEVLRFHFVMHNTRQPDSSANKKEQDTGLPFFLMISTSSNNWNTPTRPRHYVANMRGPLECFVSNVSACDHKQFVLTNLFNISVIERKRKKKRNRCDLTSGYIWNPALNIWFSKHSISICFHLPIWKPSIVPFEMHYWPVRSLKQKQTW